MKTNIRFLVMIAVSLLTVLGMSAQEPFFLHKEGVKLTYADKDKKGKINSYTETTATKVTGDADNCTVTYSMMVMDNKKNPVLKQPMTQTFEVKNGTVTYDPKSLVGQIMEGMQVTVTGTPFQLPSNVNDAGRTKPQSAVRKSPIASEPPRQTTRGNASLSSRAKPGLQRNNKSRSLSLRLSVRNGSKISRSYCAFAMLNSIDIGSKFGIDTSAPSSSWTEIRITVSVNFRLEVSSS